LPKPVPQLQLLHQLLRQRRQVVVPAVRQAEVRALAAEPLVVLDLPEPLVVLEPVLRVLEQLRQEQLLERSRLLVRRLQVLVLLAWWVLQSLRLRLLIR
jgi:hypothetical protein